MSITVYTKPYCQACDATKRWLTKRGVRFTETPLADHPEIRAEAITAGLRAAPIVVARFGTSTDLWCGFNPGELTNYATRMEAVA